MTTPDTTTRLPIFISYGHKSHEETVLKIKAALEARGHRIWIDTEGITEGTDWRRKIYDGILHSQLFLAFVSNKSVESEYCQTEIRIAVGAPQNLLPVCPLMLEKVDVPQSISHIQTVNFVYDENDPAAFEAGLKSVTAWIDRDEHVAFCQEMEGLREKFGRPESFEARLRVLMSQPFVGRKWLLDKINEWDQGDSRLFGVIGGPGFGKSIFAANLRSLAPEKVAAAQFIEWDKASKYAPKQIIKSLAFQLAARITQYRELLIDAVKDVDLDSLDESSLFDKLLSEPLAFENPNNTYWVILDALDEATAQDGQNPFVQTLMRNMDQLPKWLKFIVTSRPDATVVTYLKNRGIQLFDTDAQIQQWQHDDMMEYLHEVLKECKFSDDVLESVIAKSQGMFLYLHFVCQDIRQNKLSAADISQLPAGIHAIYQQYFDRQFGGERYDVFTNELRPVLRLYSAALEPLPLDFIAEALDKSVEDVRAAIDRLGTLKTYSSENGREYFILVHKSIWDWLSEQPKDTTMQTFRVAPEDGLPALKDFCLKKINGYKPESLTKDVNCEYPLKHIVEHLIAMNDLETIWGLLSGEEPLLSKIQNDYFGNYNVALESLKQAIVYYLGKYIKEKSCGYLSGASRLLVSFQGLLAQRRESLGNLFKPGNTLEKVLEMMEGITDARQYFMIGCYLLTKAEVEHWDIAVIVNAIVEKCKDRIPELSEPNYHCLFLDQNRCFLVYGILMSNALPDELVEQLLSCLSEGDRKGIGRLYSKVMENPKACFEEDEPFADFKKERYEDIQNEDAFEQEKQRILALEDDDERIEGLKEFARRLADKGSGDRAGELLHILEGEYDKSADFKESPIPSIVGLVNLYNLAGLMAEGKSYLLSKEKVFKANGCDTLFMGELCKVGMHREAYSRFEEMSLKALTKSGKKVEELISPFKVIKTLCKQGEWTLVEKLATNMIGKIKLSEKTVDYTQLLASMVNAKQFKHAQSFLTALFEKSDNSMECLLNSPCLIYIMRELQKNGCWTDEIPTWDVLKDEFERNQDTQTTLADYGKLLGKIRMSCESVTEDDVSLLIPDIEFGLLASAWELFINPPEKSEDIVESENSDIGELGNMPTGKSFDDLMSEMKESFEGSVSDEDEEMLAGLADIMKGFGPISRDIPMDLDFFGSDGTDDLNSIISILKDISRPEKSEYREQLATYLTYLAGKAESWDIGKNQEAFSLLLKNSEYLSEDVFNELAEMLCAKIAFVEKSDYSVETLTGDFVECLLKHGMDGEVMEFLGGLQNENLSDAALKKCLEHYNAKGKLFDFGQTLDELTISDSRKVKALLGLLRSLISNCEYEKTKDVACKAIPDVLGLLRKYYRPTKEIVKSVYDGLGLGMEDKWSTIRQLPAVQKAIEFICMVLSDAIESKDSGQMPSVYGLISIAVILPYDLLQEIIKHSSFSSENRADVFLKVLEMNDWPTGMYDETVALIKGIGDKEEQDKRWAILLNVCILKNKDAGVNECLAHMDNSALVANADNMKSNKVTILEICQALKTHNIQPEIIASVLGKFNLFEASLHDLCGISPYLLSEDKVVSKLIKQIADALVEASDLKTLETMAQACPELGIGYMFEEPAVTISVDDILELRRQLSEEEITRKGYNKKIAELLEGVKEDVKARFEALEHQLDEEEITFKGYKKQLEEMSQM